MNKLESAYAQVLEFRKRAGEVLWYAYESMNLRLADKTFWKPDFLVLMADGSLEIHECKGHFEDHARVRVKVAAELYPFKILVIRAVPKKDGGGFSEELI